MIAVGYVRVSTEEQATVGVSIAAQEESIRAYCTMRGINLSEVIVDPGVSAGKPLAARHGGGLLLKALRKRGGPRAIVAWKLDRLFRDVIDCLSNANSWERRGIAMHLIDLGGQAIDTSTAMGKMFLTMMAAIGAWERNVIGERTSAALQHKKARGEFVGTAPFGHRRNKDRIEPDPAEQAAIEAVIDLTRNGMSRRAVANAMNNTEHKPRGKRWHANTIARILRIRGYRIDNFGVDTIV